MHRKQKNKKKYDVSALQSPFQMFSHSSTIHTTLQRKEPPTLQTAEREFFTFIQVCEQVLLQRVLGYRNFPVKYLHLPENPNWLELNVGYHDPAEQEKKLYKNNETKP